MASSPEHTPSTYAPSTPVHTPSAAPVYSPSNPGMPDFNMPPTPAYISATPEYTPSGSGSFLPEYASATSEFYTLAMSYTRPPTPSVLEDADLPSAATDLYNPSSPEFYQPMFTPEDYAPASASCMWPPTPDYTPNSPEYTSPAFLVLEDAATSEHNPSSPELCQAMFTPDDYAPSEHNDFCPTYEYESYYPRPLEYLPLAPSLDLELSSSEYLPLAPSLDSKLSSSEYTPAAPSLDLELSSSPSAPNLDLKL